MRDVERRKLEKFERQKAFFEDNAADFPPDTPGRVVASLNTSIIDEMNSLAGDQSSEFSASKQATDDKDDLMEDLVILLKNISRAASAFEDEVPGSDEMFRLPRNRSEANMLTTARAFIEDAQPFEATFITYGIPADFIQQLTDFVEGIEAAKLRSDSKSEQRASATAGLIDAAKRGMANSKRADAIVRIKYHDNPQKLAAWTVASHLERPPKKSDTPSP